MSSILKEQKFAHRWKGAYWVRNQSRNLRANSHGSQTTHSFLSLTTTRWTLRWSRWCSKRIKWPISVRLTEGRLCRSLKRESGLLRRGERPCSRSYWWITACQKWTAQRRLKRWENSSQAVKLFPLRALSPTFAAVRPIERHPSIKEP